jgi:hypothetical protein
MLVLPTGTVGKEKHCGGGGDDGRASDIDVDGVVNKSDSSGPRQLYVADTLDGVWSASNQAFPLCNNPSGATHPHTGAAWLLCHGGAKGYGPGLFLWTAPSWDTSPAAAWTSIGNIFQGTDTGHVREGACEDPSLSIGPGGDFHVLAHCYSTTAWNGTGQANSPGRLPFCTAIDCHPLGNSYTGTLLSLLSFSVRMTVPPRASRRTAARICGA